MKSYTEIERMRFICDMAEKYPVSIPSFSTGHEELYLPIGEVTDEGDLKKLEEYDIFFSEEFGDWFIYT